MKNKSAELPPILPNIQDTLKEYLICPDRLPIHEYERNQEYWPREPDIPTLFDFDRVPCGTTLKVQRDPNTGKIIEFREVPVTQVVDRFAEFRDGPLNFPLSFGDLSNPLAEIQDQTTIDFTELLSVPPGFERGLKFAKDGFTVITEPAEITEENKEEIQLTDETDNTVNLMALVNQEQDLLGLWSENKSAITSAELSEQPTLDIDESEVLPNESPEMPVLNITKTRPMNKGTDWAVMVDIEQPVNDFQERIPKMAIEYEFELDTFQKQAILKLEEHCDVFVAAHTSAGKTVVAEYAIALSQKHKTRTIYTSPIKALSNQKYRDFKNKFEDVGLVTGDIQINQTGVCLIMTTEILRSMLYRGSDIIADLEYVIFDEVHYINDAERGYVWEEVLILLPDHVRIVLLSATVPNAREFANWLGMTKQRKVYVISTSKRPVPLKHYLYTGIGGKTKDERFLLVDENEKLLLSGYAKAKKAHEASHGTGDKFKQTSERRAMMGLIDHLQREELLPVVAFTFSRAKCDQITDELHNLSLTTVDEKRRIESFFRMCVQQLKEPDRQLPQVLKMQAVLVNGIGVHHSGILPIIKEIVEILFSNGLVKVLFATETFAMGVNMPARTVVFNNIKKFDGKEFRYLKPGEYIQMAGRAGRRGKDKNGTVIIRYGNYNLPDLGIFQKITQGTPQKLQSQFRLTYSLILNALRLESWVWTVESVMSHSFHEVKHVTKADELKVELERTEAALAEELRREYGEHLHQLVGFYKAASEYIEEWDIVHPKLMNQAKVIKEMIPGRVLIISHQEHYNKLAILLNTPKNNAVYKVLVLANQKKPAVSDEICITVKDALVEPKELPPKKPAIWYRMVSYTHEDIFQPEGAIGHEVLEINDVDVTRITDKTIKIDCDLVLKDWSKRQIPRFRDDPPGQTCQQAIQQLAQLTNNVLNNGDSNLQYLTFPVIDLTLSQEVDYMNAKKKDLLAQINCTKIANFEEQFYTVFKREQLEAKLNWLKFSMSSRSLSLYPEYMYRIEVLTRLEHINEQKRVLPKGNVARKMSMNELLITELVLRNTLTHFQPCEIAALLSALVFQAKVKDDKIELPDLTATLNKGMKEIAGINKELRDLELRYRISNVNDELNFGLVAFVNEWARGMPFADIMNLNLTNIQEGIIVRCILQLNETLKDVREAASKFGNSELPTKIDEAVTAIKRDIVFAASLYTQNKEITVSPPNPKFD